MDATELKLDDEGLPVAVWCEHCDTVVGYELEDGGCDLYNDPDAVECDGGWHCSTCAREAAWLSWMESTLDEVEQLAERHGWEFDRDSYRGGFNTRSRYYTLSWVCPVCCGDDEDGECECDKIKLRISDHGSAYCREDLSLAMGGDDHTLESLAKRLAK
jgi:hypothetical protein